MLSDRIQRMAGMYHTTDIYPASITPEFDRMDLLELSDYACQAKRTVEYILAQEVGLTDDDRMVGKLRFNGCIEGEIYNRCGYKHNGLLGKLFYKKPVETLATYDSQHSTANFQKIIEEGLEGQLKKIELSRAKHQGDADALDYLDALETVTQGMIARAEKCAAACEAKAIESIGERKDELLNMARILRKVPAKPAESFHEAVQCLYFMFAYLPDSIGTPDRYLYKYYQKDLADGVITEEDACELLQELFVMINAFRPADNYWSGDKGGESHFSLGGFTAEGEDGFNELSWLIVRAMMELPLYRPQVSLRWTPKTPIEVLRFVMDCERHDFYKRFAFVNDVPRIKMYTEHIGLSYEDAVKYTMVGCNEPAILGSLFYGGCKSNCVRALTRTLYDDSQASIDCRTFDEFMSLLYKHYEEDINRFIEISNAMNLYRAKDIDMVSSILLDGPIEKARSATRGGCINAVGNIDIIGWVTLIDSLCVICQHVYEEKRFSMEQLIHMLRVNWEGYEDVRRTIYRTTKYHGNDDPMAKEVAKQVSWMIKDIIKDKRNVFGFKYVVGNQTGYCQHNVYFGRELPATPDGRYAGDSITFGGGQGSGRDRKGLTALLNSIAEMDPACIVCGPCVSNVLLDEVLITNDSNFEKIVSMVDSYFRKGGLHIQLNYVSKDELMAARAEPEKHENLRVRVSGFSGYYVRLEPGLQDEILERTIKR